jgi:uncharacterized caspase-like protein
LELLVIARRDNQVTPEWEVRHGRRIRLMTVPRAAVRSVFSPGSAMKPLLVCRAIDPGCSMPKVFKHLLAGLLLAAFSMTFAMTCASEGLAQAGESRLALVIGNSQYRAAPLATPANDAGLVAQTLQEAGFDVTGAADLDQQGLRQTLRDFLDKVRQAGPGAVVFVYLSGRGVQYAGENYFVPVDAMIARDSDVPVEALRLNDYTQALASRPLKARIYVFDAARGNDFAQSSAPLAGGLGLVEAESGSLYAFNAAPGTIAPDENGPYGVYAQALVEMMHQGLPVNEVFTQTRLRANQISGGTIIPWDVSKIDVPVFFFRREANAPLQNLPDPSRALRDYPVQEAYALAVDRDTITAYQEFLFAFPRDPLALRVRALLAARREALTWRRALDANSPQAYWTYMRRYPRGPHFADARRRLAILTAPLDPPPRFDPYDFVGLAPPPESEYEIVDRPVLIFDSPDYPPLPPMPVYILLERPREFVTLPPPPRHEPGLLPIPVPIPLPFSRPAAPHGSINPPKFGQQQQNQGTPSHEEKSPALKPPPGHELPKFPEHAAPEHIAPQHTTPEQATPEHELPPQHKAPEHAAPEQHNEVQPQHQAPEHAVPEQRNEVQPQHKAPEHAAPQHQTQPPPTQQKPPPKKDEHKRDEK